MEQLVRDITTQFINKLPKNQEFFTPEDLRGLHIPEFLVQRVELEMTRNLSDSIVPPYSEWADMSQAGIQKSWQHFIDTILEEVRMPVAHAQAVFETSVGDVVEIILQPRLAVPSIIFGTVDVLQKDQIEKNARFVTINKHFPTTLLRYMEKKGKGELTLEACKSIVERIDERLTNKYNPLNWTQLLEPLFILAGPSVDTNLFRLFFEDKKMNRVARRFDMLNSSLNKTQFIEELSAPDLLKEEGYNEDQSTFFEVPAEKKSDNKEEEIKQETPKEKKNVKEEAEKPHFTFDLYSLDKMEEDQPEETIVPSVDEISEKEEEDADTLLTGFHKRRSVIVTETDEEIDEEEDENDEIPLHSKFMFDDGDDHEEITEEIKADIEIEEQTVEEDHQPEVNEFEDGEEDERPIFEVFGGHNGEDEDDENTTVFGDLILSETEIPDVEEEPEKVLSEEEMDEEESPIWQAFLSGEEENENIDKDGFIDDPIIDLTKDGSEELEEIEKLSGWLMDDKARFVEEIFGGSENAYEQSIGELVSFDNWKDASRFIEKEIFSRNMVDMYEEAAVDFTDRLHTYFKEIKSNQKQ